MVRATKDFFGTLLSILIGSGVTLALILVGVVLVLLSPLVIFMFLGDHVREQF